MLYQRGCCHLFYCTSLLVTFPDSLRKHTHLSCLALQKFEPCATRTRIVGACLADEAATGQAATLHTMPLLVPDTWSALILHCVFRVNVRPLNCSR
jgi:hypothetical protein